MALTKKNKQFCEEYIKDYNATQAYLRTYECAYNTAGSKSGALMRKPEIQEYIKELQKIEFAAAAISAERVGLHLASIAFDEDELYASASQMKALDLLQKQLGLQKQNIDANVNQELTIEVNIDED